MSDNGQFDIQVVGHVTLDKTARGLEPGGSAYYMAQTALLLGARAHVITSAGPDFPLRALQGCSVAMVPSRQTTIFENRYQPDGHRDQWLLARATALDPETVREHTRPAAVTVLCPVADEVDPALAALPFPLLGAGPQGWMRRFGPDGLVEPRPWLSAPLILPHTDILILSAKDLAGSTTIFEEYAAQVRVAIMTRGCLGAAVRASGEHRKKHIFALPTREKDPTGAGDVFTAAFLLFFRRTQDVLESARWAACVASMVVEAEGTSGLTSLDEVIRRRWAYDRMLLAPRGRGRRCFGGERAPSEGELREVALSVGG